MRKETDLLIKNPDLTNEAIVDTYNSLIWTERYNEYGDFEVEVSRVEKSLKTFLKDRLIVFGDHNMAMIIEDFDLTTNINKGDKLKVKGRSLESILERRIIHDPTNLTGSFEDGIKTLLDDAIITPTNTDRQISNFVFEYSGDTDIQALTIDQQYHGENLYKTISTLCQTHNIGFRVRLENNQFIFKLYKGQDRSRGQLTNPFIEFSPEYNNLINSNYYEQNNQTKNYALVAGEGEGADRKTYSAAKEVKTGLDRKEIFVDAAFVSSSTPQGILSDEDYDAKLEEKGLDEISRHKAIRVFDGVIEQVSLYEYGVDYFIGDKVQFENRYGIKAAVRITEVITSRDDTGLITYPSFRDFEL